MNEQQPTKKPKGFAALPPEKRREIARKGGRTVSNDRAHMVEIGRRGGMTPRQGRKP